MDEFDPRIVRIGIEIGDEIKYYEGLNITAQGTRYGSDSMNECQIRIDNMTQETRNYILRATSPYYRFNYPLVHVSVEAGRKSYGTTLVYYGAVSKSYVTQPPEIGIILNCLTSYDQTTNIIAYNTGARASVRSIAQKAADDLGLTLNFQATDKQVSNFSMTGDSIEFVQKLEEMGNYDATIDNKELIIKDTDICLVSPVKEINKETGMIGIPELTESGILVKYLLDNDTMLYQNVKITSELNPSVNGEYQLYKLAFDISNRNTPFYWIAECSPLYERP